VIVAGGISLDGDYDYLQSTERFLPAPPQATSPRQPGDYLANFTTWPQRTLHSATLRQVADPTGTTYQVHLGPSYGEIVMPVPERTRFTNFTLEVTLDHGDAQDAAIGVFFRRQGVLDLLSETYLVFITPEGTFSLVRIDDKGTWNYLQPPVATATIQPSGPQRLRVICDGDTIAIFINERAVGRYHAIITTPGQVGLYANNWGDASLDAVFSQLRIVPLP
jgi:hypothetical protein